MNNRLIVFKGSKNGITILINKDADFEVVTSELKKKLEQSKGFFGSTSLNIELGGRDLEPDELERLKDIFKDVLVGDCNITVQNPDDTNGSKETSVSKADKSYDLFGIDEGITKFYKKTVRSGQRIEAMCNLVIVGDVNPGAELLAYGNIVVFGSLKGIVHAGCNGNREAFVAALNFNPSQLRIGDIFTRSPDGAINSEFHPEIAFIKNDTIVIEPFLAKKSY